MITISHLRKEFSDATPLTDVCAEIKKGEVISIIGPSGTGKSTLLRCINRLETPTSGQIFIDGEEITAKNCRVHLLRRRMGMVFQSFNLFPNMTVVENVMFGPVRLLGRTHRQAYERGIALLRQVGLADQALRFPDELSGGQKQRAAIARTLAMDPEIILFDEPTSALDPTMVGEVLAVIRGLASQGMTMLIVTHEMKFARDVSTRVFYMDEGVIYEQGTPEQIFGAPQKEKARRFVRRLQTFEEKTDSRDFDFIGISSRIEEFGRSRLMDQKKITGARTVIEELCIQTLLPRLENDAGMKISMEYAEDSGTSLMKVFYRGGFDPLSGDAASELPMLIVKNVSADISHTPSDDHDYSDCVTLRLK